MFAGVLAAALWIRRWQAERMYSEAIRIVKNHHLVSTTLTQYQYRQKMQIKLVAGERIRTSLLETDFASTRFGRIKLYHYIRESDGAECQRFKFRVEGDDPETAGVVYVEAIKLPQASHWTFNYMAVDFPYKGERVWIFYEGQKVN